MVPEAVAIAQKTHDSSPGPWLFYAQGTGTEDVGKYQMQRIWRHLQTTLHDNGLRPNRVHTFRHNFCSWMANQGVSPFIVMRILGHGSLDIVMQYYHLSEDEMIAALRGVNFTEMLREPKTPPSGGLGDVGTDAA